MTLKECYETLGGDYEDTVKRLINENILRKFVVKFLDDPSYSELCRGMREKDAELAFRAAHTLKGVCQNLGFTALYESDNELTEKLRTGSFDGLETLFGRVMDDYRRTERAIRELSC